MADFVVYNEVPEYLNVEDITNVFNNTFLIRAMLLNKGYSVGSLKLFSAKTDIALKNVAEIFNNTEYNLDIINAVIESQYYGKSKRYSGTAPEKSDVWRWFQILNDLYSQLADEENIRILKCTDGYPTINGKRISLVGE